MGFLRACSALLLACSRLATAQQSFDDALGSQQNLSNFLELLQYTAPSVLKQINDATSDSPITVLAPSNEAFKRIPFVDVLAPAWADNDTAAITAITQYHVIPGTWTSDNLNGSFKFLPTLLQNQSWTTVTGGQRIGAVLPGAIVPQAVFVSGQSTRSVVSIEGIKFKGGIINMVEAIAIPPVSFVDTAAYYNLNYESQAATAFLGALYQQPKNLTLAKTLNETKDLTVFVPNNIAFEMVSGALTSLSPTELDRYLSYHVVVSSDSSPIYTSSFTSVNGTNITSLEGDELTLYYTNNAYFVNSARLSAPNLLISNGVMHLIDNVLNPEDASLRPEPLSATQVPVFPTSRAEGSSFNSSAAPFTTYLENIVPTTSASAAYVPTLPDGLPGASSTSTASATSTQKGAAGLAYVPSEHGSWWFSGILCLVGLLVG